MVIRRSGRPNDVIVCGAGNAGLVAAIAAAESGAEVSLLEAAPFDERGGNSAYTLGGFRVAISGLAEVEGLIPGLNEAEREMIGSRPYPEGRYLDDLLSLSKNGADPDLCSLLVKNSYQVAAWLKRGGVRFGPYMSGFDPEPLWMASPGNFYAEGGGKGLVEALTRRAGELGVEIVYDTGLEDIRLDDRGRVRGVVVSRDSTIVEIECGGLVLACGGFEANAELRGRYLGAEWERMKVRGTRFNTGKGIEAALRLGASRSGQWNNGHAVPIASEAPDFGSPALGTKTRRCLFQFGISVDKHGRRFMDEGANIKTFMYSTTGVAVSSQVDGCAYQIFDRRFETANFEKAYYLAGRYHKADSLYGLADSIGVPPGPFVDEIGRYNAAVREDVAFNPAVLDSRSADGVNPPRSNYAARIVTPPFLAFQVVGGITFTYGGLRIDQECRVLREDGRPIDGLYAAGEVTGGFFAHNYPSNSGLMRGAVTGYLAGRSSALDLTRFCEPTMTEPPNAGLSGGHTS